MDEEELIGNAAAAAYLGIPVGTWRPYVNRNQAPQPDRREIKGGHALPVWRRSTLDGWVRPGRGARTDLVRSAEGDQA